MSGRRESDDLQQKLIDALPDLVWVALPDGTIDACNRSWPQRFGVTPDAPGYDWLELMHADDRDAWGTIWRNALVSGVGFEIECRLKHRDGWRWYQIYLAPLADDQGRRVHWLFKAIDIHHSKELETNLRNSRNQAELLNQVGLDLVGELDLQRLTQRVTDTARALVDAEFAVMLYHVNDPDANDGHRRYAVSGLPEALFSELDMPQAIELFRSMFTGQNVVHSDDVRCDPRFTENASPLGLIPGQLPMVSYLAVPVRTRYGTVFGGMFCGHSQPNQFTVFHERLLLGVAALAATTFDGARLIESERRHRRVSDQRTTELARSNAELEQFAYICSHDLQEPLRMVSSFLSLIEERYADRLDERGIGFIRRAMDGSARMQTLIRDILAFSRVGRGERGEEILAMEEVAQAALDNLHSAIADNQAHIEIGPLPQVRGNRLQCVQLLQNLIGNAVKFHGKEAPVIRVAAAPDGQLWRFSVTDNGIGIDPAHHQRIFQVFQRLHGREQFEGTGIGLSLCQKIVMAHGGTIGVDSRPGSGATFWFTLPGADAETDTTPTSAHRVVGQEA